MVLIIFPFRHFCLMAPCDAVFVSLIFYQFFTAMTTRLSRMATGRPDRLARYFDLLAELRLYP
jgi:hypothetical protein